MSFYQEKFHAARDAIRAKIEELETELNEMESFLGTVTRGSWSEQEALAEIERIRGRLYALTELRENHGL